MIFEMRQPATGITPNLGNCNQKIDQTTVQFSLVLWTFSVHGTELANTSYCFYYLNSLVSWSAIKQKTMALSLTKSEYYAMRHAMKEAIVLCLEPPIAQFGSLILKVVTVPTPSFHFKFSTNPAIADGFGYSSHDFTIHVHTIHSPHFSSITQQICTI